MQAKNYKSDHYFKVILYRQDRCIFIWIHILFCSMDKNKVKPLYNNSFFVAYWYEVYSEVKALDHYFEVERN